MIPYNQHLASAGRKNSLFTGKGLWYNQALGGAAICSEQFGERGQGRK